MKQLLYVLLAVSMVSCDGKQEEIPANQLASNDFESVDGWTGGTTHPSLTKEKAHTGRYALKVGPGVEYSMGYNNELSRLSPSRITKIKVRAWVNIPNGTSQPVLVTTITSANNPVDKPLMWEGLKLSDQVKTFNKWVEVEKTITFPPTADYKNRISICLWRTAAPETALLDDLIIEKVE